MSFLNVLKEVFIKFNCEKVQPEKIKLTNYCPNILRNSLTLRVIDTWDDEATMAELYSLEWPNYSLESYGIKFTASPKHADGLLVVGAVTKNMAQPLKDAYAVVPNPKVLIVCGDKAISGDKRFWEVAGSVKQVLNINPHLEIPWNPPTAKDIFNYLVSFVKAK